MASTPSYEHLPKPQQFTDPRTLSTKKARGTPSNRLPYCPTVKNSQSMTRTRLFTKPPSVTRNSNNSFSSIPGTPSIMVIKPSEGDPFNDKESYFDLGFVNLGRIGQGSFGEVFKMKSKEDGKFYAIKRTVERCGRRGTRSAKEVNQFQKLPDHPNVIKFYKSWKSSEHTFIQMELCETTLSYLCEENHEIPESLVWKYLIDLLLALKHLHDHDLVHMDIKPANIFISKFNICKLGDFGLVLDLKSDAMHEASEGDAKYVSAEAMKGIYSKAADIFSLGITILELACDLDLPDKDVVWQDLRKGKLPRDLMGRISPQLIAIIESMMMPNYLKRPSVDDLLALPEVVDVWQKRKRIYSTANMLNSLLDVVHSCLHRVSKFFDFILKPFKCFTSDSGKYVTPKQSPKTIVLPSFPSYECGADECFEDLMDFSPDRPLNVVGVLFSTPKSHRRPHKDLRLPEVSVHHTPIQPKILFTELNYSDED